MLVKRRSLNLTNILSAKHKRHLKSTFVGQSCKFLTIKSYKTNVKGALLRTQNEGDSLNWQNDNFPLYNIPGLRKSCITRRDANNLAE